MALRLRVTGHMAQRQHAPLSRVFGVHGGRIGRAKDNDWVLADTKCYLSGYHALISHDNGRWLLTDTSSNGTFLNSNTHSVGHGNVIEIKNGDCLRLGEYTLEIEALPGDEIPPAAWRGPNEALSLPQVTKNQALAELLGEPMMLLAEPATANMAINARQQTLFAQPQLESVIRADATAQSGVQHAQLSAFWRALGITPETVDASQSEATLTLAGQIIRELALGLTTHLQQRSPISGRWHVGSTAEMSVTNSIFRLAAGVDDVLQRLFTPKAIQAQTAIAAVRNGFADLRHHDTATQTALSTAMEQYLAHLDPTALEQRFADLERSDTEGDASTRRRFQDLYADMYRTLTQRSETGTVPTLFAAEFAKAYAAACRAETHPTGTTLASWGRQQAG